MNRPWSPIQDYEIPPGELADGELRALAGVWTEQKDNLGESAAVQRFNERLRREWAIETGLIERLYAFDRGIAEQMIERGLDAALLPSHAPDDPDRTIAPKALDYRAHTRRHRAWVRLGIGDGKQSSILFSFHGIGHEFQGVLACSASWFQRVPLDERTEIAGDAPLCDEVFQINYKEDFAEIEVRYADWLERALERGLAMWESTIL